ncbi:MAG: helix-turn-helix domain-containing protein [Anaerolineae bacterium]|nr:helix-turn-helix domain-containing protein [Anaerolineae bacterium]
MEEISLTPQEFRLLRCVTARENQVCEYEYIVEQVWPEESRSDLPPGRENLAALMRRLRDKINIHDYIKNHPGRGYEFVQWER